MRIAIGTMAMTALVLGVVMAGPRIRHWWEVNAFPVMADAPMAARESIPFTRGDWAATRSTDWGTRVMELTGATRPVERPVSTLYGTPARMVTPDETSVSKHARDLDGYAGATTTWGLELRNTPMGTLLRDDDPSNDKRWDGRRKAHQYTAQELEDAEWGSYYRNCDNALEAERRSMRARMIEICGDGVEDIIREMERQHWDAIDAGMQATGIESSLELVAA